MTLTTTGAARPGRRLHLADLLRLSSTGLRTRKVRAALSALGIAIGVAAIVAVLGLSQSAEAGLLSEIGQGANLLTAGNGQSVFGSTAELPTQAPGLVSQVPGVTGVQYTGQVSGASVFRSPYISPVDTNDLTVDATSLSLPSAIGTGLAQGTFLNAATAAEPDVVLGAVAAQRMGIDRVYDGERVWLDDQWFYVTGILRPDPSFAPAVDDSALVGWPAAKKYLGFDGHPSMLYVRTQISQTATIQSVLAKAANPESPDEVDVSLPSDALAARAAAQGALNSLFLGLGAVALLVGAIGVANIMVISVLERRSEIGLRRALGATRGHIRMQFLSEAILLSLLGGAAGVAAGAGAVAVYTYLNGEATVIPTEAWAGGIGAAIVIGALAGLLPALRAARMSPTQALWSI